MFNTDKYFSITDIQNNLHSYNGGRQKLITFLKNEDYFIQEYRANKMLIFKATDIFRSLLKDLMADREMAV
jgi:hypothetical protein